MDTSVTQTTLPSEEDDEWDTDGFVIPSLEVEEDMVNNDSEVETSNPPSLKIEDEENIYLGPHGAPPSQQQDSNTSSRKQRFKQKLKEADQKMNVSGRENKMANLRELVGGDTEKGANMGKGVSRDWLDPHCHESQFEKRRL
ncbi:hypothetical protein AALP_AA8G341700 [Arabis alpina]|uniref:Uncharacterized protein n=1 Tax=Arabis alpina TaxID=50452 RepID=A0A087GB98_ARAAL|nr:hypothetical protein AALP_AA8G341700 [Arabis alpina]